MAYIYFHMFLELSTFVKSITFANIFSRWSASCISPIRPFSCPVRRMVLLACGSQGAFSGSSVKYAHWLPRSTLRPIRTKRARARRRCPTTSLRFQSSANSARSLLDRRRAPHATWTIRCSSWKTDGTRSVAHDSCKTNWLHHQCLTESCRQIFWKNRWKRSFSRPSTSPKPTIITWTATAAGRNEKVLSSAHYQSTE